MKLNYDEQEHVISLVESIVYNEGQSDSDKIEDLKEMFRIHLERE